MARDGAVSCLRRQEMVDGGGFGVSPSDSDDVHVLAVDDSLVDRKLIERLLRISSCKVTAVDSGWRALQFLGLDGEKCDTGFDRLKVDLIITDYCMPGMTGYDLLKKIKESSTFREIPVVIMSSENVLARIDRCLEEGAEEFLLKPVKLSDVKRLRDFMAREVKAATGNKRKLREESCDLSSSASSISPSPPPSSISPSPPPSTSSSNSPSSDSSPPPSPSVVSSSAPCSSPTLDSPTRRQKMTSSGLDENRSFQ